MSNVEILGCPTASGLILQYASQHAFLAMLTHNPLHIAIVCMLHCVLFKGSCSAY